MRKTLQHINNVFFTVGNSDERKGIIVHKIETHTFCCFFKKRNESWYFYDTDKDVRFDSRVVKDFRIEV